MSSQSEEKSKGRPEGCGDARQTAGADSALPRLTTLLKYGMSAGISFVVDYGLFILLLHAGLSIMLSTYIARACSCIVNFLLNRNGVFRSSGNYLRQLIQYLLLVIAAATVSGLAVTFLTARFPVPAPAAKFCVEVILFFINYLVQKKLIFRA